MGRAYQFLACPRQVNIPAPQAKVEGVRTHYRKRAPGQKWVCRKAEAVYDAEVFGRSVKKSRRRTTSVPVLKLTGVIRFMINYKVINLIDDLQSDLRVYPHNLIWIIPAKGERLTERLSHLFLNKFDSLSLFPGVFNY
jgi:hypothetical protein